MRAVLTAVLVALPILVATIAAQVVHNDRWTPEQSARARLHGADASLIVSKHTSVRPRAALLGGDRRTADAKERDPAAVDLGALLPAGSRTAPDVTFVSAQLATGGRADVMLVDLTNPMTRGLVSIAAGRAPQSADEIAVPPAVGRELDLVTASGQPKVDASIAFDDGIRMRVVGVTDRIDRGVEGQQLMLVGTSGSTLRALQDPEVATARTYLVDLPEMSHAETHRLVTDLAARGVALTPRDAIVHPRAWGLNLPSDGPVDLTPVLVGALCILVGLGEVVLLVGAAFSVAARRQIRDLGLLVTNGGAARDVRRALLAQGLVLGVLSSLAGAGLGLVAFRAGAHSDLRLLGGQLSAHHIDWFSVVVLAALGSLTSVVAAVLPGWRVSRLTPVETLSGRFPVRPGESRAHFGALVLTAVGLALLLAGGWATAEAHAHHPRWETAAVVVAAGGLVLLVGGAVWGTPYVVRRAAALGRALPLAGRYAFRDAGRHRFRSAAAVMALMITVAGAVLAGFGFKSAARADLAQAGTPEHILTTDVFSDDGRPADPARTAAVTATIRRVVPVVAAASWYTPTEQAAPDDGNSLLLQRGQAPVLVTDEASLARLVDLDAATVAAFRSGSVVTTKAAAVRGGQVRVVTQPPSGKPQRWVLPAVAAERLGSSLQPFSPVGYVSAQAAARLGFVPGYGTLAVRSDRPITQESLDRLRVYGIEAWSHDPARARLASSQYAGLAAAALLTALVVGLAVAMAAAESRGDVATLAAVGAGPWRRRGLGAMHGLFLGLVGSVLGLAVGIPAGMAFTQVDGLPGLDVAWLPTAGTVAVVLALSWLVGAAVTPTRFQLTRRIG